MHKYHLTFEIFLYLGVLCYPVETEHQLANGNTNTYSNKLGPSLPRAIKTYHALLSWSQEVGKISTPFVVLDGHKNKRQGKKDTQRSDKNDLSDLARFMAANKIKWKKL